MMKPVPTLHWVIKIMVTLAALALFILLCSLGWWQIERRAWKLALMERVEQRLHTTPIPLPELKEWPAITAASHEYQPVEVQGHWLKDKTVFTQATTVLGAGFWLLTPLQLEHGAQVLVNRGFIPAAQRAAWQEPEQPMDDRVAIQGLIRMTEVGGGFLRDNAPDVGRWHSRDVTAIATAQGLAHVAPFFIDAGLPDTRTASAADMPPTTDGPWPRPGMTVVRFHNNHAVYAVTWFTLALMVLAAVLYIVRWEYRKQRLQHASPTHV